MKYIRTKDGRVAEIIELTDNGYLATQKYYIDKFEIIKQADTIEELCDEFVYENKLYKECKFYKEEIINTTLFRQAKTKARIGLRFIKGQIDNNKDKYLVKGEWENVYGAIWTNKGLIYVAKMNEKGELELL